MEKIIIENRTELPMADVVDYVNQVIRLGRISNYETQYCYATTWKNGIVVEADKNKCSDRFLVIFDEKMKQYYEENKDVR
jgi:hypothetical protein